MMWQGHVLGAAAVGVPLAASGKAPPWIVPPVLLGGLLLDLCQRQSKISQLLIGDGLFRFFFRPAHRELNTVGWAVGFALFFGALAFLAAVGINRWTEWTVQPWSFAWVTGLGVFLGCLSHIVLDWLFDGSKPFHPHTNGLIEHVVARPAFCVVIVGALAWGPLLGRRMP